MPASRIAPDRALQTMETIKRAIGIYCASSPGNADLFTAAAQAVGEGLARRGIEAVYGGGRYGLMGVVADAALAAGGRVTGVMTQALVEREITHPGLTTLHVVGSMHERKTVMSDLADGFIALPGGPGALEEICEQWTWGLLGIHAKPCGLLNVEGYFDPLQAMITGMVRAEFLRADHGAMVAFEP